MYKNIKLYVIIIIILFVILYTNKNVENYIDAPIPAIIFMRHGEEYSMKGLDVPDVKPTKIYPFANKDIELTSKDQTLAYWDKTKVPLPDPLLPKPYGVKDTQKLYERLKTKLGTKYADIDTIITINPEKSNGKYPTKNPFLTAYYYVYGESGDNIDPSDIINKTDVTKFKLIDSKDPNAGIDGCDIDEIQPEKLDKYIHSTGKSVLVIVTRDTIWGKANTPTMDKSRLLYKYQNYYNLKYTTPPVLPAKARTVYVISGQKGNGTFKLLDV